MNGGISSSAKQAVGKQKRSIDHRLSLGVDSASRKIDSCQLDCAKSMGSSCSIVVRVAVARNAAGACDKNAGKSPSKIMSQLR